jgi:hypothetical protein
VGTANDPPRGVVELPADGVVESPPLRVAGWAGDDRGIVAVRVLVDGRLASIARFVALRPDVTKAFPALRHGTDRHGWEALVNVAEGISHTVRVEAIDTNGTMSVLGSRHVTVIGATSH